MAGTLCPKCGGWDGVHEPHCGRDEPEQSRERIELANLIFAAYPSSRVELPKRSEYETYQQGDGTCYYLKGFTAEGDPIEFHHDKAWINMDDVVYSLLTRRFPGYEFSWPGYRLNIPLTPSTQGE